MKLIVAGHGTHLVLSQFALWASFTSTARNVIELTAAATSVLRDTWSALEPARRAVALSGSDNHSAAILIAGFDDSERMQVAYLSSHVDFEPAFLRTGVYLSPSPKPRIDNVTAAEPATANAVVDAPPSPPPSEPWVDQTQRVVRAVRAQQAEQSPGFIGGRLWGALLTVDSIFQSEITDLDEPVPDDYAP